MNAISMPGIKNEHSAHIRRIYQMSPVIILILEVSRQRHRELQKHTQGT